MMTDSPNFSNTANQHLREYLAYYLGFEHSPHYAVLLTGRWGIGKTFQVKKVVDSLLRETGKRRVLVSLYGLKSAQEIDDAMVSALYPWTDNDGMRMASAIGKAVLKHAKIELPKIKSSDLVNGMSADVFIFDDLERCRMPVTDILGYINQLVERDGCKVIVLANEEEIAEQDAYTKGKEKLIGKTLSVEIDFDAAFRSFVGATRDVSTKEIFEFLQQEIRDIHEQSTFQNLRILQQTMWDFERFFASISPKHRANGEAMRHLLRLFFVLSLEHKAGCILASDIAKRTNRALVDVMRDGEKRSVFSKISDKYPGLYIYDSMLSDTLTTDALVHGVISQEAITASLDASSWFVSNSEPSWRTIWHSSERRDADVKTAALAMLKEFRERKYDVSGEFMHLFGQMLFLADLGASGRNRAETLADCKAYVDDLRAQKRLEPIKDAYLDDIRHGSYDGLGFSQKETPEFKELWGYVHSQRAAAEIDGFVAGASNLIEVLKTDPAEFVKEITHNHEGSGRFANRPVLASANLEEFADALIQLNPIGYREALLGLSFRYDMGRLAEGRELASERSWAVALERLVIRKADTMECFAQDRIKKVLSWTLGEKLEELNQSDEG